MEASQVKIIENGLRELNVKDGIEGANPSEVDFFFAPDEVDSGPGPIRSFYRFRGHQMSSYAVKLCYVEKRLRIFFKAAKTH